METGLKVRAQGFRTLCTQAGTFRGGDVTGEAEWKACAVWTYPEGERSYGAGLCNRRKKV